YRGTTSGGESLLTSLGDVSSWTDAAAAYGTTYFYRVTAVNPVGEGAASNERSARPTAGATVPGAPTGVTAVAGDASAVISFAPPASNGGAAIFSYTLTASPGGLSATGGGSPILLTGLTNGVTYTFTATATNIAGTGPPSASSNAVTPGGPTLPPG